MELRLRLALVNLWVVTCVLPWTSGDGASSLAGVAVALCGLMAVAVAIAWQSRSLEQRLVGVVGFDLAMAILRPWPTWSWLVVLASVVAVLLLGFATPSSLPAERRSNGTAPLRWRRRMVVTRVLAVGGALGGIALLVGANRAELAVPGRPLGMVLLLTGGAGMLALFALRQFFLLPAIEHIAEDSGVRAQLARMKAKRGWVRWARLVALLAVGAWFVFSTAGKP